MGRPGPRSQVNMFCNIITWTLVNDVSDLLNSVAKIHSRLLLLLMLPVSWELLVLWHIFNIYIEPDNVEILICFSLEFSSTYSYCKKMFCSSCISLSTWNNSALTEIWLNLVLEIESKTCQSHLIHIIWLMFPVENCSIASFISTSFCSVKLLVVKLYLKVVKQIRYWTTSVYHYHLT